MDAPEVTAIDKMPGSVNKPASGTYGDQANLDDLRSSMSVPGAETGSASPQPAPAPPGAPRGQQPQVSAPGTVPDILLRPSTQPGTPPSTPLAGEGIPSDVSAGVSAGHRAILQRLAAAPNVSQTTRRWAQAVLESLGS